ncbi:DoxX family protein [Sphingobium aromaticiconvertens]|uniref:DoxX family protein n=1 Tax=Sphingobium aromaticiconvertens TaxID=365341 RepID=UPI00301AB52C
MATIAAHNPAATISRAANAMNRAGWALTTLVLLFLTFDAAIKLVALPVVMETLAPLGWPTDTGTARMLGVLLVIPVLLYGWPRTAFFGAVLLTAYLGGAVATHARIGSPLATHTLFGVYVGLLMWAGLWLRAPSLRALMPVRR